MSSFGCFSGSRNFCDVPWQFRHRQFDTVWQSSGERVGAGRVPDRVPEPSHLASLFQTFRSPNGRCNSGFLDVRFLYEPRPDSRSSGREDRARRASWCDTTRTLPRTWTLRARRSTRKTRSPRQDRRCEEHQLFRTGRESLRAYAFPKRQKEDEIGTAKPIPSPFAQSSAVPIQPCGAEPRLGGAAERAAGTAARRRKMSRGRRLTSYRRVVLQPCGVDFFRSPLAFLRDQPLPSFVWLTAPSSEASRRGVLTVRRRIPELLRLFLNRKRRRRGPAQQNPGRPEAEDADHADLRPALFMLSLLVNESRRKRVSSPPIRCPKITTFAW